MTKEKKKPAYRKIPSVNKLLQDDSLTEYRELIRAPLLKKIITSRLEKLRKSISLEGSVPVEETILQEIRIFIEQLLRSSLQPVVNATGVILHTNLGRAPFNEMLLSEARPVLQGYCNLEFDLKTAQRGSRNVHLNEILKLILNCENSVVVNNNAAAMMLVLKTLAAGKEVIISRGELVEIGGSFRIPEIIESSGAKLVEVGTTNKTKLSDYEKAITENTALLLKVHKSNYYMHGFTEEVSVKDLAQLAKLNKLLLVFDLGTGLLDKSLYKGMEGEPDARGALADGAEIVTFSCDKLLGGPQAGIAAGKEEFIKLVAKDPMMRALRVDKLTISFLNRILIGMLYDRTHLEKINPVIHYINRDLVEIEELAIILTKKLKSKYVEVEIINTRGQCGGGTLPYHTIESRGVLLKPKGTPESIRKNFAEELYHKLLLTDTPVLGVLKERNLFFDVLALEKSDLDLIANSVKHLIPFW